MTVKTREPRLFYCNTCGMDGVITKPVIAVQQIYAPEYFVNLCQKHYEEYEQERKRVASV